jgi:ribosomal protein L11 methyltransferase
MSNWKITVEGPRAVIEGALVAHEDAFDWDHELILAGGEIVPDEPEEWKLEVFLPRKPAAADRAAIKALFTGPSPRLVAEELPDIDWVTQSQQGLEPIQAGRFLVHTPEMAAPAAPGIRAFAIPAGRAFGTGHHATTAGCLALLTLMKREGLVVRNLADIGTGTGLLAFAALDLWPRAIATASDIDAACAGVVLGNAAANEVVIGAGAGELTMVIADGMADSLLAARGPYDLLIANILAGPLIELAADFAAALVPGGSLLLAGLLTTQEDAVRAACRRAGLRIARRLVNGDWSILWLRKRPWAVIRSSRPGKLPEWSRKW